MEDDDLEGEWVFGWPGRKRLRNFPSTDPEGRVIYAQSPVLEQEGLITPVDAFFVMAQLQMPEPVHPDDWELELLGEVEKPLTLTLADIRRLPSKTVRAVTECAGNDADFFEYLGERLNEKPRIRRMRNKFEDWNALRASGDLTVDEALAAPRATNLCSGGEWTGTPLSEVLGLAGLRNSAVSVRAEGWDRGRPDPMRLYRAHGAADVEVHDPGEINFDKALPLEKALHPDTLLAWAHNGDHLLHVHGAPLRLVVPGWAGNWWVKWIQKIEVHDHMAECYHQVHYFVSGKSADDPASEMMTALGCKSLIIYPRDDDSPLKPGSHLIRGLAWSGEGAVTGVEVSVDGGRTWTAARVEETGDRWLWRRWSSPWEVSEPGSYRILARATDEKGRVQPAQEWNHQLKHFDGIVPVDVTVEG
ncbi:MAG: molybdopterin-dependent oxidoreductase [Rhodospirillaceae bacterium]|nr:molybdopterin-dependent oxidoreductase [Rhodospirillaceae bacterium]